jgi:hypothetical protein
VISRVQNLEFEWVHHCGFSLFPILHGNGGSTTHENIEVPPHQDGDAGQFKISMMALSPDTIIIIL